MTIQDEINKLKAAISGRLRVIAAGKPPQASQRFLAANVEDERKIADLLMIQKESSPQEIVTISKIIPVTQITPLPEIGDIMPPLPMITTQDNTLRNALIIGGALLLVL